MKKSVEGWFIYDKNGRVLYNGDYVEYCWGGGNDGRIYRVYRIHQLKISRRGKLKFTDCENIIYANTLVKIDHPTHKIGEFYKKYES